MWVSGMDRTEAEEERRKAWRGGVGRCVAVGRIEIRGVLRTEKLDEE